MNLFSKLQMRAESGNPIRVGVIGAGKFASMFFAQANRLPGIHVVGIVDLFPETAMSNLANVGWPPEKYSAKSIDDAIADRGTHVGDDWQALVRHPKIEIVIECTGDPIAAVDHCLESMRQHKDVINVTVEADAFCGAGLSQKASEAGVIYSMAYGDQPALVCDLVDWARACGFPVVAAGRGHKWLPHFQQSTPDTVWDFWGLTREQAERGRLNPKLFNSFLDGSKPAIESAAIANATGLDAPREGLSFPPGSVDDIPTLMRPKSEGGQLESKGMVEVVSCLTPEGVQIPHDIRKGVWVCFEGDTEYLRNCFEEYSVVTDPSGRYMSLYKKWHLIGLELGISVASVGLRREATGAAKSFRADVVAVAKRDLSIGEVLDGEGGYTVSGGLRPTEISISRGYLPLGLANDVTLKTPVAAGQVIGWGDISAIKSSAASALRRELEAEFSKVSQNSGKTAVA